MEAPRMPLNEARSRLDDPDLTIIDVRRTKEKDKIAKAIPEEADETESWMKKYPKDKAILLYCS